MNSPNRAGSVSTLARLQPVRAEAFADPAPAAGFQERPIDVVRMIAALRRRKGLILGLVVLVTATAALLVGQITPLYRAESQIVVEGSRPKIFNIETVAQGITPDYYTNETEAAVIASRSIAQKVVERLELHRHPSFNPELAPDKPGLGEALRRLLGRPLGFEPAGEARRKPAYPWHALTGAPAEEALRDYLAEVVLDGLIVIPSQRSRLLTVQYVSPHPALAARIANAFSEAYLQEQLATKGRQTQRASTWLNERVSELRSRIIESEAKLEEFRRSSGLIETKGANVLREQQQRLQIELITFRAKRAEAEARFAQTQQLIRRGGAETAAAVLDSPLIVRLREQEAQQLRRIAELGAGLREGHPKLALAKSELEDLQKKIADEVNKITINLGNEAEIARVRERNLKSEIDGLQAQIEAQNESEVTLRSLMSEVQANKQLYETVLARFKETNVVDEEVQQADARVISRAVAPTRPFYPRTGLMVIAVFLVALVIGIALALLLDLLDRGFRALEQIEALTGIPGLSAIPLLGRAERRRPPHEAAARRPESAYGEAIRSLRTALMLASVDHPPKLVLITSSLSGEGKTSTAISLATVAARSNQRAIIIDCDLRHAGVDVAFGHQGEAGLSNYLAGQVRLEDVIATDDATGVQFIPAGTYAPSPADLLGSQQMRQLLHLLARQYDLVVLDTPPLLAVSDALVLVRHVDRTVFLVRWERTRRETALAGLKRVIDAGGALAGVVLTQIDAKKQARYGSGYGSQYYYGRSVKYYRE